MQTLFQLNGQLKNQFKKGKTWQHKYQSECLDLPEPPYKGVDLGAVFVSAKAEGFRYELKYSFIPILNTIIGKVNIVSAEVSQNALNAEAYKN